MGSITGNVKLEKFMSNDILEFISGHFPGRIIIPGAVLLEMADKAITYYLQSNLDTGYVLRYIQQAMFYSILNDLSNAYFFYNIEQKSFKELNVDGVIKKNDMKIVKVRMRYEK